MRFSFNRMLACGIVLLSALTMTAPAQTITVVDPGEEPVESLVVDILELALSKSAPEMEIRKISWANNPEPWTDALTQGELSVVWFGTLPRYEQELLPIRIPVLKGLLGYRIFVIRKGEQQLFNRVHSLSQLKNLIAGQGTLWGDRLILEANGLPIKAAPGHSQLFSMLSGGQIDYVPRALHEPWSELPQFPELDLAVEQHLLLIYPFPMYFFVAPGNQALHDTIYRGLEMAIEDGSFDALFFSHPAIQTMLSQANPGQRTVLRLINPYLSPETPFYRQEFWLDPASLQPSCREERCAVAFSSPR